MIGWAVETCDIARGFAPDLRAALLRQEIGVVRITGLPDDVRAAARAQIDAAAVTANAYSNATLHSIGPYLARGLNDVADYFARARELDAVFRSPASDPRPLVREVARRAMGFNTLAPLREPDGRSYADAVVRLHRDGAGNPLHNDMIARDASGSGLRVARSTAQLSVIYCVQECGGGGELVHFQRRWDPADERHKVAGRLGYADDVIDGARALKFRPTANDLYLIDPRNYHKILPVAGQTRITMGSFILLFEDCPNRGWSMA